MMGCSDEKVWKRERRNAPGKVVRGGCSISLEAEGGGKVAGVGLVQVMKEKGICGAEGGSF